jgi:hypothetical protein
VDAWNAAGPEPASAGDREAVGTAEQTVSDAWIGELLLAESETQVVVRACVRVRKRTADRVRTAQRAGDLAALVRAQQTHEHARARLAHELAVWSGGVARRGRQARADRSDARRR